MALVGWFDGGSGIKKERIPRLPQTSRVFVPKTSKGSETASHGEGGFASHQ